MLSILIPVYNYDIVTLVKSLHVQLTKAKIEFEIICQDDLSDPYYIDLNIVVQELSNTKYKVSDTNKGIAINRQLLVNQAEYDWIILIDADTELKDVRFILNYISHIDTNNDFIFGGFDYKETPPNDNSILRWKYGKQYEALNAVQRNKNRYKITIAANLLARKEVYRSFNIDSIGDQYAMDYYFGALLKLNQAKVLHVDNQVYHLGIEKSSIYLRKKELAAETLLRLFKKGQIKEHSNDLLKAFILLKKTKLNYLFSLWFRLFEKPMKRNLIGKQPWIKLLQLYKITYMCHFDLKTS